MSDPFLYPTELIPDLKNSWESTRFGKEERVPMLPSDEILLDLLNVSYHASLLTEEQRRLGFRLVFCEKEDLVRHPRYLGQKTSLEPIEFNSPIPFSVSEIVRLAPATDLTRVLICVGLNHDRYERTYRGLKIWGIIDTGSSWWNFTQGESSQGYPPPNLLTVSSTEPGHLSFSRQGVIILTLRNGQLFKPSGTTLSGGPVADFFRSGENQLFAQVDELLIEKQYYGIEIDNELIKREYRQYLQRILFQIRMKRHGGTLLVVPDLLTTDDPRIRDRLNTKYPCVYDRNWKLIIEYLVSYHRLYESNLPIWSDDENTTHSDYHDVSILKDELHDLEVAISDSVKFIASLSGVDGAVLITDRFRVLGFGVEVIALSPSLKSVRVAANDDGDLETVIPFDAYGTRHRSAFRFCSSYEDSVVFVVSQDGGVKAVKQVGPDLVLWPDINFGLLGI